VRLKQRLDALDGRGEYLGLNECLETCDSDIDMDDESTWPAQWRGKRWDPKLVAALRELPVD
jgi:hypothetical protein